MLIGHESDYEVKRVVAQDLMTYLKRFAFEQSPGLRDGIHNGFEVQKAFSHIDPVPLEIRHIFEPEMCTSAFGFSIFQTPPVRHKRSFSYMLSAEIKRTLPYFTKAHLEMIPQEIRDYYDDFTEMEIGAITETSGIEFATSEHELREIEIGRKYDLAYAGDTVVARTNEELLYDVSGYAIPIPSVESEDYYGSHFVVDGIEHEAITGVENVITNTGFWSIVEPFRIPMEQGVPYDLADRQMRAIVHALRTGEVVSMSLDDGPEPHSAQQMS